jgi:N-acetylglucosamine-6-phosphate deacetylase
VRKPDVNFLDKLYDWTNEQVKLLTLAPEVEGAQELCKHARKLGISISLGHHMGTEADVGNLAYLGARALTHLGNGIPKVLPRHHNPLWAGLAQDALIAMIITDGHHLPPSIIKTIIRTKGASKIIVVSDASPIAGLPPGRYHTLGNEAVLEESGLLQNPETGYLVGSASTMRDCMNHLLSLDLLSFEELLDVGFYNPLRLIGLDPGKAKIEDTLLEYDERKAKFVLAT